MVSGSQMNSGDISPTSYDSLISWPITISSSSRIKRAAAIERQRQIQTPISIAISKAISLRLIKPSAASASVASSRSWAESNTATRCCTLRPC
ncbi:hypothetical protein FOXYSP1_20511 [Fusarium oxysporum f. sp. phaseoli]